MTLTIATILSLLLALATAGNTTSSATVSQPTAPSGVNLNHNETLVRDAY
ncbi:MAG TPA: hypothetical protein VKF81_05935 [Blastocatellia bacterium]|nr:hypothetical protein [Blastocatellia bacterium]